MSRECGRNIAGSQTGGRGWEISEGVKIHEHKNTDDNKNLTSRAAGWASFQQEEMLCLL